MDQAGGSADVKSALFVRGGWEGHEPEKTAGIFASFLQTRKMQRPR